MSAPSASRVSIVFRCFHRTGNTSPWSAADPATQNIDIYLFEFARGVSNRFTFDAVRDVSPVWSADSTSVIYTRFASGIGEWYRRAANLAGEEELLFRARNLGVPSTGSPDGRFLLFTGPLPGPADIQAVDLSRVAEAREAIPVVTSEFNEANARFSPDGRWFAYASNESGAYEIYVRPFNLDAAPGEPLSIGGRVMVSKGGATAGGAIWRADGKELFYLAPDGTLMAVAVDSERDLQRERHTAGVVQGAAERPVLRRCERRPAIPDTGPGRRGRQLRHRTRWC